MVALRNIAIIAALAFVVAAVPGGGDLANGVTAVLSLAFLVLIGVAGYFAYRQNSLTIMALTDRQRALLFGAFGAIVLMIAGANELFDTGAGVLLWLAVIGASIFAIVRVVIDSRTY